MGIPVTVKVGASNSLSCASLCRRTFKTTARKLGYTGTPGPSRHSSCSAGLYAWLLVWKLTETLALFEWCPDQNLYVFVSLLFIGTADSKQRPTTMLNMCPLFATHQVRAYTARSDPTICTEDAAQAVYGRAMTKG